MPAFHVALKHETLAEMGELKAAIREVRKEWEATQRQIHKDIRDGKAIDPKLADKAIRLKDSMDSYAGREKRRREIEEVQKKSLPVTVRKLLDTHNPHGQLRQILSGNVNASRITDMAGSVLKKLGGAATGRGLPGVGNMLSKLGGGVEGLGAAGMARVGLVAMVVHKGFEIAQEYQNDRLEGAKMDLGRVNASYAAARAERYNSDPLATQILQQRRAAVEGAVEEHGVQSYIYGNSQVAKVRGFRQETFDYGLRNKGRISAKDLAAMANLDTNALEVQRKFGWKEAGIFGALKSATIDRLTGTRAVEEEEYAMELAQKRMKGKEQALDAMEKDITENPIYKVAQMERSRMTHAVWTSQFERFNQWNPY